MSKVITKIEVQKKNKNRLSIFLNEKFAFGIYYKTFIEFNLKKNMKLTEELIQKIKAFDEYNKCFNKALNYISYKERTESEVRKKLYEKEYLKMTVDSVIKELKKLNYIDDLEYAKRYIEFKIKKMGKIKIRYKLIDKGIDDKILDSLLLKYNKEDEFLSAFKIARKKNKQYGDISYKKRYSRLASLLKRKGYSYSVIREVTYEILEEYKDEKDYY